MDNETCLIYYKAYFKIANPIWIHNKRKELLLTPILQMWKLKLRDISLLARDQITSDRGRIQTYFRSNCWMNGLLKLKQPAKENRCLRCMMGLSDCQPFPTPKQRLDEMFQRHNKIMSHLLDEFLSISKSLESRGNLPEMSPSVLSVCWYWRLSLHAPVVFRPTLRKKLAFLVKVLAWATAQHKSSPIGILSKRLVEAIDAGRKQKDSWAQENLKGLDRFFNYHFQSPLLASTPMGFWGKDILLSFHAQLDWWENFANLECTTE